MKRTTFLAALFVLLASCAGWSAGAAAAEAKPDLAAGLQDFVDRHALAGAVTLAATKDRVLEVGVVGWADVEGKKPMRPDSLFWIASMSKPITAAAVMMLVDEGKLNLDDPVEKHLPEFKGQRVAQTVDGKTTLVAPIHPITLRNVLSHTSGLPFKSPAEEPTLDGLPLADAVRSYAMLPLRFQPDSRYEYSNAGINTAARVLEVVSGMPYEKFMDERLFRPLGMTDTTFWPNAEQLGRLAKAYKPNAAKDGLEAITISQLRYPLDDRAHRFPMPAGGLFSTAGDCAKFCQMVLAGGESGGKRYLSEAAVRQMTSRQTAPALKESYGLGWSAGGDACGHGGAYATNMTIDVRRGLITVFMVQHAGFPLDGGRSHEVFRRAALEKYR